MSEAAGSGKSAGGRFDAILYLSNVRSSFDTRPKWGPDERWPNRGEVWPGKTQTSEAETNWFFSVLYTENRGSKSNTRRPLAGPKGPCGRNEFFEKQ
jgi:hypothetical protein